jgi:hypothetical protein
MPSETSSQSDELICNYDMDRTKLHRLLEASAWDAVVARCQTDPIEARTWMIRHHKQTNKLRWRLLPLHTAVIFASPFSVVSELLKTYPAAASKPDDQGMIPLHLAFRHYENDERILQELLQAYPEGVNVKDYKGRMPIDLGRKGEGLYSATLISQYSAAFAAATPNDERETKNPVSLKYERASSPNPAQDDLDQVASTIKSGHAKEIAAVKGFYEERIQSMVAQTMKSLANLKMDAEEANRDLRDQHYRDMSTMRELLAVSQKEKDTGDSERLRKEIVDLKLALQRARSEQAANAPNENLSGQILQIRKDHETLQVLIRAQQVELDTAQEIRAVMLKTLMVQDEEDHATAMQDGQRLVSLADIIQVRMEKLPFGAPIQDATAANESLEYVPSSAPAHEVTIETVESREDEVSALSDQPSL